MTESPWFGILLTLGAWSLGRLLRRAANTPLADPVLVAVTLLALTLWAADIPYESYARGGDVIGFLLGPAVVALAVPLWRQLRLLRDNLTAILVSVSAGCVAGVVSAVGLGWLLGASRASLLSLAPKSVTTPIALEIAERIGGTPPLTIALVVATGILGGMLGPDIVRRLGIHSPFASGLAVGTAAHGIGTARALQEGELQGTMSSIGMTLNGALTALLLPLLAHLLG
jgi:predicted murein hydrolase (TIGR00659 family)